MPFRGWGTHEFYSCLFLKQLPASVIFLFLYTPGEIQPFCSPLYTSVQGETTSFTTQMMFFER